MASDLPTKLLIKADAKVLLLNAPIGYARKLEPLPAGSAITDKRARGRGGAVGRLPQGRGEGWDRP